MKQNYSFKTAFIFVFSLMTGIFSAQNGNMFFQPANMSLMGIKINKSSNEIYVNFGTQSGVGIKKVSSSATDLGDITNESTTVTTIDENGNVYYILMNTADIKKVDIQNNNNRTLFFTAPIMPKGIAFANNKLYYSDQNNGKIYSVDFSGGSASTPTTIFDVTQSRPSELYIQGGFLYAILSGMGVGVSKVIKLDLSNSSATPVELATGLSNPKNLCVDATGKVYYARTDQTLNRNVVDRVLPSGNISTIDDGTNGNINGMDVDGVGNIYYTTYNANNGSPILAMYKISSASLSTKNVNAKTLSVVPNPAKDFVNLSNITKGADVSVFDMTGKLLYQTKATGSNFTLNTSSLKNGIYLLKVDGQTTKLLIAK